MKRLLLSMVVGAMSVLPMLAEENEYVPVVREGVEWGHKAVYCGVNVETKVIYYREQLKGDTVIDGNTYKKCYRYTERELNTATAELVSVMREADKKLYVRAQNARKSLPIVDYPLPNFEGEDAVYDLNPSNSEVINEITIAGKKRKMMSFVGVYGDRPSVVKFLEGTGFVDDNNNEYGLPMQMKCASLAIWDKFITYEKIVGGDIVYKTDDFDENDPALRTDGVVVAVADDAAVRSIGGVGVITMTTNAGATSRYAIYGIDGTMLGNGVIDEVKTVALPSGIYIVRTETGSAKVDVK